MTTAYTEADLLTITAIQEKRGNTREAARKVYKRLLAKLANPDVENRAELVLAAFQREDLPIADASADAPTPTLSKREKREARKEASAAKKAAKKAAKAVENEKVPLPEIDKTIELTPTEQKHVYVIDTTAGKFASLWLSINHDKEGAAARFGPVNASEKRLALARQFAKMNDLSVALCVTVKIKGKLDQGYVVPFDVFNKFKVGSKNAVSLSNDARAAYAESGVVGVKFVELKPAVEEKAAA